MSKLRVHLGFHLFHANRRVFRNFLHHIFPFRGTTRFFNGQRVSVFIPYSFVRRRDHTRSFRRRINSFTSFFYNLSFSRRGTHPIVTTINANAYDGGITRSQWTRGDFPTNTRVRAGSYRFRGPPYRGHDAAVVTGACSILRATNGDCSVFRYTTMFCTTSVVATMCARRKPRRGVLRSLCDFQRFQYHRNYHQGARARFFHVVQSKWGGGPIHCKEGLF